MGGLALKHLGVKRIDAVPYLALTREVVAAFWTLFKQELHIIQAYYAKPDYGDCDAVVVSSKLPQDWREQLIRHFDSPGMVKNGDVTSIAVRAVQFDFIGVPENRVEQATTYFAYNDLGNLMGRVAHKMGFKYGHLGFHLVVRDDHHVLGSIDPEAGIGEVFDFLGYDYSRWATGFKTLEDIFEFVASSQYFNPAIYLLHNRNAVSRVRDAKRRTYTEFLKWCETPRGRTYWPWADSDDQGQKSKEKELHKFRAFERWPQLQYSWELIQESALAKADFAKKFNGHLVSEWTGLTGKDLGAYMTWLKSQDAMLSKQTPGQIEREARLGVARWRNATGTIC